MADGIFETTELDPVVCPDHGEYRPSVIRIAHREITTGCSACADERRRAEEIEQREQARIEFQQRALGGAGVPRRFEGADFGTYSPPTERAEHVLTACTEYAARWDDVSQSGRSLALCGHPGTGKTHLAISILKTVIRSGGSGIYTTAIDLCRAIKSTWGREAEESEAAAIARYARTGLLVLDEIGVQFGSDTERLMIFDVIDQRYRQMLPTILVSNLTLVQMTDVLGERVIDRMRENSGMVLAFGWGSHRGSAAA